MAPSCGRRRRSVEPGGTRRSRGGKPLERQQVGAQSHAAAVRRSLRMQAGGEMYAASRGGAGPESRAFEATSVSAVPVGPHGHYPMQYPSTYSRRASNVRTSLTPCSIGELGLDWRDIEERPDNFQSLPLTPTSTPRSSPSSSTQSSPDAGSSSRRSPEALRTRRLRDGRARQGPGGRRPQRRRGAARLRQRMPAPGLPGGEGGRLPPSASYAATTAGPTASTARSAHARDAESDPGFCREALSLLAGIAVDQWAQCVFVNTDPDAVSPAPRASAPRSAGGGKAGSTPTPSATGCTARRWSTSPRTGSCGTTTASSATTARPSTGRASRPRSTSRRSATSPSSPIT